MKEKIIAELKTAYAKLGLSDEAFDGVASLLEKTVTEESEIATAVGGDDVKGLLKTIQGQVDSWKNKFHDKDKELKTYKESHPDTKPDPKLTQKEDEEPEAVKQLREKYEALAARLDAQDEEAKRKATIAFAKSSAKEAGCTNEKALGLTEKLFAFKKDESDEDAAERFKTEYNANVKEYFGDGVAPFMGNPITAPAKVSTEDKAAKAREDAKRVREG